MRFLVTIFFASLLISCVEGVSHDPVTIHKLKCGEKLVFYTCTDHSCFALTAPMEPGYVPQTHKIYRELDLAHHIEEYQECQ